MSIWVGWSRDRRQIERTQVLAVLLSSTQSDGQTGESVDTALHKLEFALERSTEFYLDFKSALLFETSSESLAPTADTWILSSYGRATAEEFLAMQDVTHSKNIRAKTCRRALLNWVAEQDDYSKSFIHNFLDHPYSFFYGDRFTASEIQAASRRLEDKNLVAGARAASGRLLRLKLTSLGEEAMENHDGDPDAATTKPGGTHNTFYMPHMNATGANQNFGGEVQAQSSVINAQDLRRALTDVGAALKIAATSNFVPDSDVIGVEIFTSEIENIDSKDDRQVKSLLERAAIRVKQLATTASDEAAKTFFQAVATYLAVKFGIQ